VDVVTGGASASYGSDAGGGGGNFVVNTPFQGLALDVNGGETTYGDGPNEHITVTAGHAFMGGRLRVEGAAEYFHEDAINLGLNGRSWYDQAAGLISLPAGSATQMGIVPDVRFSTMAYGGLIT